MRREQRLLYPRLLRLVAVVVVEVVVMVEEPQGGRKVEGKVVGRDEVKEEEAKDKDKGRDKVDR